MDADLVLGGALAAVGLAVVAGGLWSSASDRRREAFTTYLDDLSADAARGSEGSPIATAARSGAGTVATVATRRRTGAGPAPAHTSTFDARLAQPFLDRTMRPAFARVAALVSSVTPTDHRARVRSKLAAAGLDLRRRPEEIIALQVIGFVVGTIAAIALIASRVTGPALGASIAMVLIAGGGCLPLMWLSRRVDARVQAIRTDLPDTLDLLAISVEAGVGLEGALQVVTERSDSPLAQEMGRTLQEMGLGLSRRDALTNLKHRSPVPELSNFVQALIQADSLGMPLARVLKIQATEMRSKRRQWARERAAKLPVKILFPLVMCIFPAVLVVVVGPAMSQIGEALK